MVERDKNGYVKAPELKTAPVRRAAVPQQESERDPLISGEGPETIINDMAYTANLPFSRRFAGFAVKAHNASSLPIHFTAACVGGLPWLAATMGVDATIRCYRWLTKEKEADVKRRLKSSTALQNIKNYGGISFVGGGFVVAATLFGGTAAVDWLDKHITPSEERVAFTTVLETAFAHNNEFGLGKKASIKFTIGQEKYEAKNLQLKKVISPLGPYWEITGQYGILGSDNRKPIRSLGFPLNTLQKDSIKKNTIFVCDQQHYIKTMPAGFTSDQTNPYRLSHEEQRQLAQKMQMLQKASLNRQ